MNKMMREALPALAVTLSMFGLGCNHSAAEVGMRVVHQDQQCQQPAGLSQLTTAEELEKVTVRATPPGVDVQGQEEARKLNKKEHFFLISLGQKSSGGYDLELTNSKAKVNNGALVIPVKNHQPAPGSVQTMQITSPCIVIAVERGDYREVQVEGQTNWRTEVLNR